MHLVGSLYTKHKSVDEWQVTSPSPYRSTVPTSYQTLVLISFTQGGRCRECAGIRRVSSCVSLKLTLPIRFHVIHLWFTLYMLYLPSIWRHTVCTCVVCVTAWLPTVLANTDGRIENWLLQGQCDYYLSVRNLNVLLMLAHANTIVITIRFIVKFLRMCLHAKSIILVTILSILETVTFFALYVETSLLKERLTPCAEEYVNSPVPNKCTIQNLTLRWLMSYIYGAPILDVSRSHTTTQHSR